MPFIDSRADFCPRLYTHTCIPETHACSSRRHMAVLQQVAVKTSRVYACVHSFVRSLVRSLVRASALASGYRLYMQRDVYCSGVAYERVSRISIDFLYENLIRAKSTMRYRRRISMIRGSYLRFYEFRRTRGTIERLSIPGKSRPTYFIFYELAKKRAREKGEKRRTE